MAEDDARKPGGVRWSRWKSRVPSWHSLNCLALRIKCEEEVQGGDKNLEAARAARRREDNNGVKPRSPK